MKNVKKKKVKKLIVSGLVMGVSVCSIPSQMFAADADTAETEINQSKNDEKQIGISGNEEQTEAKENKEEQVEAKENTEEQTEVKENEEVQKDVKDEKEEQKEVKENKEAQKEVKDDKEVKKDNESTAIQNKAVKASTNKVTIPTTKAKAGDIFTAKITSNGVANSLDCKFKILTESNGSTPGTVEVATDAIDKAFAGTIAIPNKISDGVNTYAITAIGEKAFMKCANLTNTGLENNTSVISIGNSAYSACMSLISTGLESNKSVTTLGIYAFMACRSLTTTGLESNGSVTTLSMAAFANCAGLTSTGLESNKTVTTLSFEAFENCADLQTTGLEGNETITAIGEDAFNGCKKLTSTGLENNKTVISIGPEAFFSCPALKTTGLENNKSVKTIGRGAFYRCTGMISTGLDDNTTITLIGVHAFKEDVNLHDIHFSVSTLPTMDRNVFDNMNIYYLPGATNIPKAATIGAKSVQQSTIDNIAIKQAPSKLDYAEGHMFNPNGLVLTINYDGGKIKDIPYQDFAGGFTFDKKALSLTDKEVTITYGGKAVTQKINVVAKKVKNVSVKTQPNKVNYVVGQKFDPTGLVMSITYDDGTTGEEVYAEAVKDLFSFDKSVLSLTDKEVTITYDGKTAPQKLKINVAAREVDSITISNRPQKTKYIEGQSFIPKALAIDVVYNDGTRKEVAYDDTTKDLFSFDKTVFSLTDRYLVITYGGKSVKLEINVTAKKVNAITVKTQPSRVDYIEGRKFDPRGLVVNVSYDNGTNEDIAYNDSTKASFTFDKTALSLADKEVTITYGGKTAIQNVNVVTKKVDKVAVKTQPSKVDYVEGQKFDPTGLVMSVSYNDGTSDEETYDDATKDLFSFDKTVLSLNDKEVTITFDGKTAPQKHKINVVAKKVDKVTVKTQPGKTDYVEGQKFDPTGLVMNVSYNNGTNEDIAYNDKTKALFSFDKTVLSANDKKVIVTYGEKSVELAINVKAKEEPVTPVTPDTPVTPTDPTKPTTPPVIPTNPTTPTTPTNPTTPFVPANPNANKPVYSNKLPTSKKITAIIKDKDTKKSPSDKKGSENKVKNKKKHVSSRVKVTKKTNHKQSVDKAETSKFKLSAGMILIPVVILIGLVATAFKFISKNNEYK